MLRKTRPYHVVLIFLIVYLGIIFVANEGDPEAFVVLGDCFKQCTGARECQIPDNLSAEEHRAIEGYDGQFNYYIARDPAKAAPCIDVPAYRYQRILLPLSGWVFGLGGNSLIPVGFVLVNGFALAGSTRLLEDLLRLERRSSWFALSYGLFFGLVIAARLSTSEPLAYGLVVLGIWAQRSRRGWLAAIALGLAGLAKETTGLITAGFLLWFALNRRWREAARLILIAGLSFFAWQMYLYEWLGTTGIGSGGAMATGFELIPFGGVLRIWTEGSFGAFLLLGVLLLGVPVIVPSLWGLWQTVRDLRGVANRQVSLYSCLLFSSAVIMPFVPFSTYREFLGILRFIPGLVLMVVLYSAERNHRRPLMYSTLWIALLLFLVAG